MKRLMKFLGTVLSIFLLLLILGYGLLEVYGRHLDRESRRYAREVAQLILENHDIDTLLEYAAPQLQNSAPAEEFDDMFALMEQLGPFVDITYAGGKAYYKLGGTPDEKITAFYEIAANFEGGLGWVRLRLVKIDDTWWLLGFQLASDAFSETGVRERGR